MNQHLRFNSVKFLYQVVTRSWNAMIKRFKNVSKFIITIIYFLTPHHRKIKRFHLGLPSHAQI